MASSIALLAALLLSAPTHDVAGVTLTDQRGRTDRLVDHRDRVVLVMVVTAKRLRNLKAWERDLHERFEALDFLRVADVPSEPPVTVEQVSAKLVRRVPERVSILIDIERAWATQLELDTQRPNLLLYDRQGRLAAQFRGRHEPELAARVADEIARLLGRP